MKRLLVAAAVAVVVLLATPAAGDQGLPDREDETVNVPVRDNKVPDREDSSGSHLVNDTPAELPAPCTDAPCRTKTPATITTDGGSTVRVPPGRFVPEPAWLRLDAEIRRLQDAETRLGVENKSLREAADRPGWGWIIGAAVGFAGGVALAFSL